VATDMRVLRRPVTTNAQPATTDYLKIDAKKPPILPKNPLCSTFFTVTVVGGGLLGMGVVGSDWGAAFDFVTVT
jgi:hypothetical protein